MISLSSKSGDTALQHSDDVCAGHVTQKNGRKNRRRDREEVLKNVKEKMEKKERETDNWKRMGERNSERRD
jgi:hypothetical protein